MNETIREKAEPYPNHSQHHGQRTSKRYQTPHLEAIPVNQHDCIRTSAVGGLDHNELEPDMFLFNWD